VRHARGDLERDRHVGERRPVGEPKGVAEQDLVRTHLDQERWQPAEIAEDRADPRVGGVRAADVVRHPETEPFRREDRIDRLVPEEGLA
jgi:hypothetical protein